MWMNFRRGSFFRFAYFSFHLRPGGVWCDPLDVDGYISILYMCSNPTIVCVSTTFTKKKLPLFTVCFVCFLVRRVCECDCWAEPLARTHASPPQWRRAPGLEIMRVRWTSFDSFTSKFLLFSDAYERGAVVPKLFRLHFRWQQKSPTIANHDAVDISLFTHGGCRWIGMFFYFFFFFFSLFIVCEVLQLPHRHGYTFDALQYNLDRTADATQRYISILADTKYSVSTIFGAMWCAVRGAGWPRSLQFFCPLSSHLTVAI